MKDFFCTLDFERVAQRRLPAAIFDFIAGGAGSEIAQANNESSFSNLALVPRILRAPIVRSTSVRLFGIEHGVPFGISPMGLGNLAWPGTDDALLRMAARARLPYTLSTAGSTTIERAAELAGDMLWFQLYVGADFGVSERLLERASKAGVRHLLLTVDAAYPGLRYRDRRNGFGHSLWRTPRLVWDYATHPNWSLNTLLSGVPRMINLSQDGSRFVGPEATHQFMASMLQARLDWDLLRRLRDLWPHHLLVKGVLDAEDARQLQAIGVDGLVVSNHGGRQLGSAVSPTEVLPDIRAAVGVGYPLILESGVRTGEDIIKALLLGADFTMLGRPWLFACAAAGPDQGASRLASMLKAEVDNSLAQIGSASCAELDSARLMRVHTR